MIFQMYMYVLVPSYANDFMYDKTLVPLNLSVDLT